MSKLQELGIKAYWRTPRKVHKLKPGERTKTIAKLRGITHEMLHKAQLLELRVLLAEVQACEPECDEVRKLIEHEFGVKEIIELMGYATQLCQLGPEKVGILVRRIV